MEFGNLTGLLWGLLAIPIVIFYILKIRLRRVPVATVMFWDQVFEENRPRSLWRQLRHWISLLLQLFLLGLLAGSIADPSFNWERLQARRLVLVIDNSASMNAVSAASTRLDDAKRHARRLIRGLRVRDQLAIVSAGAVPHVHCGLTGHQRTLQNSLKTVQATDGPTSVPAAVELARRLLADHTNGKVVVASDGCFEGAEALHSAEDVELVTVGGESDNLGITQFQVRRSLLDPIGYQVLIEVTNFSEEPVECRLDIELGEDVVDVVPLELEAEERWSKVIDQTAAEGGRLVARLDRADSLSTDNQAVALLPERKRQPVLLVTEGSLFLQRVFEAIPIVDLTMTDTLPAKFPAGAIVVFHRQTPDVLPPGNVLVIDPLKTSEWWTLGEVIENPIVTKHQSDSSLMTHVRLDNVLMPEAKKLDFKVEHQALASSIGGEPLYSSIEQPGTKALVLTVALAKGDLPLRTAFPIMMTNAITWFRGTQGELREAVATGSVVEVDLESLLSDDRSDNLTAGPVPADTVATIDRPSSGDSDESETGGFILRSPDGTTRQLPGGISETSIGPLDQCGVWSIEVALAEAVDGEEAADPEEADRPKLEFACNLTSPRESDLRPTWEPPRRAEAVLAGIGGRPIWFYLIVLALILATVEWYLYQRRWIS